MAAKNVDKEGQNGQKSGRGFDWRVAEPLELLAASRKALERYARESGARPVESPIPRLDSQEG